MRIKDVNPIAHGALGVLEGIRSWTLRRLDALDQGNSPLVRNTLTLEIYLGSLQNGGSDAKLAIGLEFSNHFFTPSLAVFLSAAISP